MKGFSIRKQVMAGAIAALALGSGMLPQALPVGSTPTAQAAELGQVHGGGHERGRSQYRGAMRRNFRREGFTHRFWGWGYHHRYPQYYTTYLDEPVNLCSAYYFDDDDGVWYCFTGS